MDDSWPLSTQLLAAANSGLHLSTRATHYRAISRYFLLVFSLALAIVGRRHHKNEQYNTFLKPPTHSQQHTVFEVCSDRNVQN